MSRLELIGVEGLAEVQPGDDLGRLIGAAATLQNGDVLVVAQKVVSKSEGRIIDLGTVTASADAVRIASGLVAAPDPRMVQVVLEERSRSAVVQSPDHRDPPRLRLRERRRRPFQRSWL